jgi:hypothetical protein
MIRTIISKLRHQVVREINATPRMLVAITTFLISTYVDHIVLRVRGSICSTTSIGLELFFNARSTPSIGTTFTTMSDTV